MSNSRFPTLACGAETRRFRSHEGTEAAFELARSARSPVSNQTIKQSKQSQFPQFRKLQVEDALGIKTQLRRQNDICYNADDEGLKAGVTGMRGDCPRLK